MCDLLELPGVAQQVRVIEGAAQRGSGELTIETRSPLGIMQGLVQGTRAGNDPDDGASDSRVSPETEPWLTIHNSDTPVANAYVQVRRGGRWYSIADSDLRSKRTFSLLAYLSSLRASDIAASAPVVTVPSR